MEDSPIKKPCVEEKSSPLSGNSVVAGDTSSCGVGDFKRNELADFADIYDEFNKFRSPLKTLRSLRDIKPFAAGGKDKELFFCLVHIASFLRILETQLFSLCLKPPIGSTKLTTLAAEVSELQGMAREALSYFYEVTGSIDKSSTPSGDSFVEEAKEANADNS